MYILVSNYKQIKQTHGVRSQRNGDHWGDCVKRGAGAVLWVVFLDLRADTLVSHELLMSASVKTRFLSQRANPGALTQLCSWALRVNGLRKATAGPLHTDVSATSPHIRPPHPMQRRAGKDVGPPHAGQQVCRTDVRFPGPSPLYPSGAFCLQHVL